MALRQNIKSIPAETRSQQKYQYPTHSKTQAGGTVDGSKRGILRVGSWGRLLSKGHRALNGLHKATKDSPSTQATQLDRASLSEPWDPVPRSVLGDRKDTEREPRHDSRSELVTRRDEGDTHTGFEEQVHGGEREAYRDKSKLAYQLRQVSTYRARVYHEKLGVKEQSRYVSYKRGEATKAAGILEQDLTQHPPGSSEFDAVRITQLVHNLQLAFRELAEVELELDNQNEKLTEQERFLKYAEDDLYQDLTGAELVSGVDILGSILDQISSPAISPRIGPSAYDELGDENDIAQQIVVHDSGRSSRRVSSIIASAHRGNFTSSANQPERLHRQFDIADSSGSVPRYGSTSDHHSDFETSSMVSSDVDTCFAGLQFSNKSELGNLQDELGITNEDASIRQKREDDLGSLLAVDLDTDSTPPEPYHDKVASPYNLAQKISKWILSVNLQSWLEFSYLVWFSDMEMFVSTMGYTKLGTFIRRNYSFKANIAEPAGDGSIRPSVSSVSDDIPLRMQQIFIHDSDGAVKEFEIHRPTQNHDQDQQNEFAIMSTKAETGHSTRP